MKKIVTPLLVLLLAALGWWGADTLSQETPAATTVNSSIRQETVFSETVESSQETSESNSEAATTASAGRAVPITEGEKATVTKFVDGDTTYFEMAGQSLKVRYLLIDTPEVTKDQPFSQEAKNRVTELLSAAHEIRLEYDIGSRQDHYGRQLMYVWADGILVQEQLAREGLCMVRYVTPPNTRYLDQVKAAEGEAKAAGRGIWSLEEPFTASKSSTSQQQVYVTANGKKYHRKKDCRGLKNAGNLTTMTEAEAIQQGYTLCGYED